MTDIYTRYETGLRALLARLGRDHPHYNDVLVYQQRLTENISAARRYGDTESRRAARAEIFDRLNALAQDALDVSFNALCSESELTSDQAPPGPHAPHVETGGGTYVQGDVHVHGGDFVGRDRVTTGTSTVTPSAPLVYAPLLIWADLPWSMPGRAPGNRACAIRQMQEADANLPPLPFDVIALPPVCLLSFDPTDRVERAWADAQREFTVILTRRDVPPRAGTSLLKLAGDLESRTGLWLGWDEVRDARNDPDRIHLLEEARRHARGNTVVVLAQRPAEAFAQLWPLLRPLVTTADKAHVLGPTDYDWPEPLNPADVGPERVVDLLSDV